MIVVRHGLMLVGYPFGGKTTTYRVLAEALECMEKTVCYCNPFGFLEIIIFSLIPRMVPRTKLFTQ